MIPLRTHSRLCSHFLAAMKTVCPTCARVIEPAEIRRGNFEEMVCPSCSSQFRGRHSEIGSTHYERAALLKEECTGGDEGQESEEKIGKSAKE